MPVWPQEHPPVPRLARLAMYPWLVVGTVCVGAFLGQLDASIAGLVLPTLEEQFQAQTAATEWVAIAYLLVLAALVIPFGRLADLAGRKMLYTLGFLIFIVGSGLCGLAPSLGALIAFRVLQAVGAAMLQANSVAIITAAVDRRKLGRAIGVQGAAQAVGLSVGPSLGGLLIATLGWRWVFFIAVPFGLIGAFLGWVILPATEHSLDVRHDREHFDWLGTLLIASAIALALVGVTFANTWGWTSPRLLLVWGMAAVLIGVFVPLEMRVPSPLIDLGLFRSRLFSTGIVAGLLSYGVLFGSLFLFPFYLERFLDLSPAQTGLFLSPIPLALAVMAPIAGVVTDRVGSRGPTVVGMLLAAAGLVGLAFLATDRLPVTVALLALVGVGLGLFTPPNNSAIMGSAPSYRLGVAGGILNMTRSLGTSLGVAVTGAILTLLLSASAGQQVVSTLDASPAALAVAFRETLLFLSLIAAAAGLLSIMRGSVETASVPAQHGAVVDVGV